MKSWSFYTNSCLLLSPNQEFKVADNWKLALQTASATCWRIYPRGHHVSILQYKLPVNWWKSGHKGCTQNVQCVVMPCANVVIVALQSHLGLIDCWFHAPRFFDIFGPFGWALLRKRRLLDRAGLSDDVVIFFSASWWCDTVHENHQCLKINCNHW